MGERRGGWRSVRERLPAARREREEREEREERREKRGGRQRLTCRAMGERPT